jgi:glycosyltransferase involved in cell wall biosynthesis
VRVLHLTDRLTGRGGAHRHLLSVLERQAAVHDVSVAAGTVDRPAPAVPCAVHVVPGLEARTRAPVALDALAAGARPDVVHLHTVVNPEVLEWARRRAAVVTVQDHRCFCPARGKWTADGRACRDAMDEAVCGGCFADRDYFREVHALTAERLAALRGLRAVVLSRYMEAELVAAGVPPAAVTVIPPFVHGLDPDARPDGPPCILFVGRLTEAKGVWDAVAAWRAAALDLPLVFAGTGPLREALERDGHAVLGWVPHERMAAVYRRARALVLPSRWQEPFGLAGLEALTLGVPVAAWDSGGIREWLGDPGVAWGDVEGLARRLREAVQRPAPPPIAEAPDLLMARLDGVYREVTRRGASS